mmetsp:Transcript_16307/g.45135  ORF Transcript_16307/g.45135 Transcript_16307/m.45135 type:complete len:1166 (+) Transcript_16307:193-3690(+)
MWPRPPVTERRDPDGHQTRVGYIMRRYGFERHCGTVTRICLAKGGRRGEASTVLTASRDGTLKCWDVPAPNETHGGASSSTSPPPAQLRCSLEEHTGWVNDCVVLPPTSSSANASRDSRRLVSASNDNLVKVWQVEEERQGAGVAAALMSMRYHIDYVTCLAYAPRRALLASAGLDSRAVVSDLEAATRVLTLNGGDGIGEPFGGGSSGTRGGPASPSPLVGSQHCMVGQFSGSGQYIPQLLLPAGSQAHGRESPAYEHSRNGGFEQEAGSGTSGASIWSLAMTHNASLLACGTASCVVRGWDPRSGTRLWRLRGHTENVRALVLSEDGTICVSGSGDRTVRVWDIGMRRCVHVFDAHHDSVWALAVAGHSCGYAMQGLDASGGAGGSLTEVFSGGRDGLLLCHDLRQMQTGFVVREPSPVQALAVPADTSEVWASATDSHVRRHAVPAIAVPYCGPAPPAADAIPPPGAAPLSPVPALPPVAVDDCIAVHGTPRLIDYKVLDNKRQVLVRDACDHFALWDATNGQCVEIPAPVLPKEALGHPGRNNAEEVMKRAFAMVNRPVSVPTWFTCDIALGSLSVYLDVAQCFKAEPNEADVAPQLPPQSAFGTPVRRPNGGGEGIGGSLGGGGGTVMDAAAVNLGLRTLRALFDSWVRAPPPALTASGGRIGDRGASSNGDRGVSSRSQSPNRGNRSSPAARPRVFVAPPALQDMAGGRRWDDAQHPGMPTELGGGGGGSALEAHAGGGSSSSSFPPATALVLVSRSGRPVGYRGRLYCGYFSASESPDLLPPWVVDVVWNQRPPPEELCGERALMFTLARCPSERVLPPCGCPFFVAVPRTRVRRLMIYLVRNLDFDWASPTKPTVRRPSSAVSLVSRLGRCCVAPGGGRGGTRSPSSDSWNQSDGGESPRKDGNGGGGAEGGGSSGGGGGIGSGGGVRGGSSGGGAGGSRSGSARRGRGSASSQHTGATPPSSAGTRRGFGLLGRSEDDAAGPVGAAGRVRIDGSPAPLPSVPAGAQPAGASGRRSGGGSGGSAANACATDPGGAALPDERCVEILCNGVVVDPDSSLATVREFVWKKPSAELMLTYRRVLRSTPPMLASPPSPPPMPGGKDISASPASGEDVASDLASTATAGGSAWGNGLGDSPMPSPSPGPGDGTHGPGSAPKE